MCKSTETHEVEISWEPPKGDFTKYVLIGKLDADIFFVLNKVRVSNASGFYVWAITNPFLLRISI